MLESVTYTAPNRVTCVPGYATGSTCKILVITLNDPTSDPVSVTVNGTTTEVSLTARGSPTVCWTGVHTVSGLSEFTRYSWSVTQGVNSDSGGFMTTPAWRDDWMFVFAGCDPASGYSSAATHLQSGAWYDIYTRVQASTYPCVGMFFVDDLGYVDSREIDDTANTGLATGGVPQTTLALNDYLIAWCSFFGMLGSSNVADLDTGDPLSRRVWYPRETHRAWCRKNLNWWPQWGDHEFSNDIGWDNDSPVVTAGSNARWTTYATVDGAGKDAWDVLLGLIQPPSSGVLDTVANHWVMRVGCVTLAAPDAITHSDAAIVEATPYPTTAITTMFGANQIDDTLNAIHSAQGAFTFMGLGNSLRYPTSNTATLTEFSSGAQHPIYDHCTGEYQRIFTRTNYGADPASLMASNNTNGVGGNLICLHSDYHRGHCYLMKKASYLNNNAENFYAVGVGTVGGTTNFPVQDVNAADAVGETAADVEVISAGTANAYGGNPVFWNLIVTVLGSRSPEECYVRLGDYLDAEVGNWRFVRGFGNLPVAEAFSPALPSVVVSE